MTYNTDPLTLKLSLREKCAYGMGDFGSNLMLCIGTLYLLKFYTDELGMPAFYGGIIFWWRSFYRLYRHADRGAAGLPAKHRRSRKIPAIHFVCLRPGGAGRDGAVYGQRL